MTDPVNSLLTSTERREKQVSELLETICSATRPGVVYGEPVTVGNYTVITASEVLAGGGFGSGFGLKSLPASESQAEEASCSHNQPGSSDGGGGMGGGGGSSGRPVAVISIGPEGVSIKPIVDLTKIVLAEVTVLGTLLLLLGRMRKAHRR